MVTISVMEKQSCTSIMLISFLGSSMPASSYAIVAAFLVVTKWDPSQFENMASSPELSDICKALTFTKAWFFFRLFAISGVVMMAQAAPSLTPQQSKSPRG